MDALTGDRTAGGDGVARISVDRGRWWWRWVIALEGRDEAGVAVAPATILTLLGDGRA